MIKKVTQIIRESLMYRKYSFAEANMFIKALKGNIGEFDELIKKVEEKRRAVYFLEKELEKTMNELIDESDAKHRAIDDLEAIQYYTDEFVNDLRKLSKSFDEDIKKCRQ